MFTMKNPVEKTGLEKAIDEILAQMDNCESVDSEEYNAMTDQLEKLYKLKEIDHKVTDRGQVSADTLAIVAGNLIGIILIVGHERANVVTSKALTLLQKLR